MPEYRSLFRKLRTTGTKRGWCRMFLSYSAENDLVNLVGNSTRRWIVYNWDCIWYRKIPKYNIANFPYICCLYLSHNAVIRRLTFILFVTITILYILERYVALYWQEAFCSEIEHSKFVLRVLFPLNIVLRESLCMKKWWNETNKQKMKQKQLPQIIPNRNLATFPRRILLSLNYFIWYILSRTVNEIAERAC